MKLWSKIERAIDIIVEVMGKIGWVLILYCMILGVIDVFLRYVLNKPSLWISTTVQAVVVLIACVGGAYALHHGAFVKLDLFYAKFSIRKKAICDIFTSVFSFLFLSVLMWKGTTAAMLSIKLKQVTPTGIPIPIYPIKTIIPIAAFMVVLVVIKKLVDDIKTVISNNEK